MFLYTFWIKYKLLLAWFISFLILIIASLSHVSIGAKTIEWHIIFDAFFSFDPTQYLHQIIIKQRLTRLIVALFCGAALGIAGFAAQKLFQNPLVSADTLGVISGAKFFCIVAIFFMFADEGQLIFPALLGSLVAGFMTLGMTRLMSKSSVSKSLHLVLAGSLVAMLFSSLSVFVMSLDPLRFYGLQSWLLGDIGTSDYKALQIVWWVGVISILVLIVQSRPMDALMLGDKQANSLGVNVRWVRGLVLGGVFIISSVVVSVVGPIGFVGLVVPHAVKLFVNETGKQGMLLSIIVGALALVLADLLARTMVAPKLLLVGAVTASIGGFVFLILLFFRANRFSGG